MGRTLSVGLACLFGATIGAFVGLDVLSRVMPKGFAGIMGAAVGGGTGWITIDFREFCAGFMRVWRRTTSWRPRYAYWKALFVGLAVGVSFATSFVLCFWLLGATLKMFTENDSTMFVWTSDGLYLATTFMGLIILCAGVLVEHDIGRLSAAGLQHYLQGKLFWLFVFSPIGVPCVALYFCVRAVLTAPRWVPTCCRFVKMVFIEVHSQRRTICFVDSAIGAGFGFYLGDAIIGGLFGAIIGMINYHVVSVRWLKLSVR